MPQYRERKEQYACNCCRYHGNLIKITKTPIEPQAGWGDGMHDGPEPESEVFYNCSEGQENCTTLKLFCEIEKLRESFRK